MDYPWVDKFLFNAAEGEDTPPDEETGTNEPVNVPAEDEPDPELAQDLVGEENTEDQDDIQLQVDELRQQIEDLSKSLDIENELEVLKRRIDNFSIPDNTDLNDSIYQTAFSEIKYVKRALRRIKESFKKQANLSSEQIEAIIIELENNSQLTCQEVAAKLSPVINANEQDIIDFIRNSDYRFRHRHRRFNSAIEWDKI